MSKGKLIRQVHVGKQNTGILKIEYKTCESMTWVDPEGGQSICWWTFSFIPTFQGEVINGSTDFICSRMSKLKAGEHVINRMRIVLLVQRFCLC